MRRGLSIARHLTLCATLLLFLPACGPDEPDEEEEQSVLDRLKGRADEVKKRFQRSKERPCIDHEECLAKEHCSEGICKPYEGRTIAEPRPDMGNNP